MHIDYQQYTDSGGQCINQDYCVHKITDNWALFITADGLGGHQAGERMAKALCEALLDLAADLFIALQPDNAKVALLSWFNLALKKMSIDYAEDTNMQNGHTTFAALWMDQFQTLTMHIGDTRIYWVINNSINRTRDHSVTQMLLDDGEISEQEMGNHPDQNRLTRTVCLANIHRPTVKIFLVAQKNDSFILCTDGLWAHITQQEILELSQLEVTEQGLKAFAKTAIKRVNGEGDNVTVQWLKIK